MAISPPGSKTLKKTVKTLDKATERQKGIKGSVPTASEEQQIYSRILNAGRKLGLAGMIGAFTLYMTGLLQSKVPLEDIPRYWGLSSTEFTQTVGLKPGWVWLGMYNYGDMLNFFGIAALCLVTIVCYLAIVPSLLRKKDFAFAAIALTEVVILVLAASGIVQMGE